MGQVLAWARSWAGSYSPNRIIAGQRLVEVGHGDRDAEAARRAAGRLGGPAPLWSCVTSSSTWPPTTPPGVSAASPASSPVSATGYYIAHYNMHRAHRSLDQRPPRHTTPDNNTTDHPVPLRLVRTTRRDGLINEYKQAA